MNIRNLDESQAVYGSWQSPESYACKQPFHTKH